MPLRSSNLGYVLLHIYDFDFGAAIYFLNAMPFEATTPCIVASSTPETEEDEHRECLKRGFTHWLNVAVVSDSCDEVVAQTEDALVAAFNKDCEPGGWLWKMMNYRNESNSHEED